MCWIAEKKYKIPNVLHLLDDFLVVVPPFDDAHEVMERFLGIFRTLGIPLSEKKTEGPCIELEYLGIILDSWNMEACLPPEKIDPILSVIRGIDTYRGESGIQTKNF